MLEKLVIDWISKICHHHFTMTLATSRMAPLGNGAELDSCSCSLPTEK